MHRRPHLLSGRFERLSVIDSARVATVARVANGVERKAGRSAVSRAESRSIEAFKAHQTPLPTPWLQLADVVSVDIKDEPVTAIQFRLAL
jgi:hypothetical protein